VPGVYVALEEVPTFLGAAAFRRHVTGVIMNSKTVEISLES
jgi:hypothetical protein